MSSATRYGRLLGFALAGLIVVACSHPWTHRFRPAPPGPPADIPDIGLHHIAGSLWRPSRADDH